jgi:hypothetical protein
MVYHFSFLSTWRSTFPGEVTIIVSINIVMTPDSIIVNASMACSWCMPRCYLITGLTSVERATPFEVCGVSAFKTLILASSIVSSIGCTMRIVRLSRCTRKRCGRNHDSNSLWFFDLLSKVRSRDCLDVTLDLMSNHHVPFIDFVGFLQQCHSLFS